MEGIFITLPKEIIKLIIFKLNVRDVHFTSITNTLLNKFAGNSFWRQYIENKYDSGEFKQFLTSCSWDSILNSIIKIEINEIGDLTYINPPNKACAIYLEESKIIRRVCSSNNNCIRQLIISGYNTIKDLVYNRNILYGKNLSVIKENNKYKIKY